MAEKEHNKRIGPLLCKILRHQPELIDLKLDSHGYADVDELLAKIKSKVSLSKEDLENIVAADQKQRYAFNEDHSKIRCSQGHSIDVDVQMTPAIPSTVLYHGTGIQNESSISKAGIHSGKRQFVHLSKDIATAIQVGSRHGKPYVFVLNTAKMVQDGIPFWISENGIWQTKFVDAKYIEWTRTSEININIKES